MGRFFNQEQRLALLIGAEGRCKSCGVLLGKGWHADHVIPFSAGGPTDVINGQALCEQCNLTKGVRTMSKSSIGPWNSNRLLRIWQLEALGAYQEKRKQSKQGVLTGPDRDNFVCVATPAAGKTTFGTQIAFTGLLERGIERIIIVVPTIPVRKAWVDDAFETGKFHLKGDWDPKTASAYGFNLGPGVVGVVTTYASVFSSSEQFRHLTSVVPTLAIFDEIHHAGEGNGWGEALIKAFSPAVERLMLSGTPWRGDPKQIPFVRYENSKSQADYSYSYKRALQDHNCRRVEFPSYDGQMDWFIKGQRKSATFEDSLNEEAARQRLKTALSLVRVGDTWPPCHLTEMLTDAVAKLKSIRATEKPLEVKEKVFRPAGGLVLAIDVLHATAIAEFMKTLGVNAVVVTHEDNSAPKNIDSFKTSDADWIIAVRMVSEGVDIKRLRVLVFATNILTELFFRQALGRVLRKIVKNSSTEYAYMYLPSDPDLMEFAAAVEEDKYHALAEQRQQILEDFNKIDADPDSSFSAPGGFIPLSSSGTPGDVIADGERFSKVEMDAAAMLREQFPFLPPEVPISELVRFVRAARGGVVEEPQVSFVQEPQPPPKPAAAAAVGGVPYAYNKPMDDVRAELRTRVAKAVRKLAAVCSRQDGIPMEPGCKQIYMQLNKLDGCFADDPNLTPGKFEARLKWLSEQIDSKLRLSDRETVWAQSKKN